jgi:DNA-directed RNA polymerase subunit RPC12/RpoP
LRERGPVYMAGGHSSVGGADYTSSPNVPRGRQSTRRRSMSTKTVSKQTPLKCLDCEHEFDGLAIHKEHYIESGSVLAKTVFDRAQVDCPNCGSHRVVARTA